MITFIRVSSAIHGRAEDRGPSPSFCAAAKQAGWLAPGVGRAGWHGTGPVEAEKDPGEQGVQVEAPAGARPTRQPLNSTAPLHAWGHPPHRTETDQTPYKMERAAAEAFGSRKMTVLIDDKKERNKAPFFSVSPPFNFVFPSL